jgi:hypothetical protein
LTGRKSAGSTPAYYEAAGPPTAGKPSDWRAGAISIKTKPNNRIRPLVFVSFFFGCADADALGNSLIPECNSGLHFITNRGLECKYAWLQTIFYRRIRQGRKAQFMAFFRSIYIPEKHRIVIAPASLGPDPQSPLREVFEAYGVSVRILIFSFALITEAEEIGRLLRKFCRLLNINI